MKLNTILANNYQIREQLSQKAGRQTFLAEDLRSKALVIIKILSFDANFEWDDLKLFEREASTLKQLNHPAIPKYLDYFEVEEPGTRGFALIQTYINAPSLETAIQTGRKFSEAEVIELVDRLLSILTYLHEQIPPVIHRDLKPSNILLGNRSGNSIGDVYLVDFGSVQVASKDGGTITIVGSYGYIPLEQFGGQTTAASDLYSLGMTIIYVLTGNHPAELVKVNGQVKFTSEVSNQFHRWVEKMTQPYLEQRFDSAKLAQISLKSDNSSYGNFIHLKPPNSKAEVYRDRSRIEIGFPSSSDFGCGVITFAIIGTITISFFWSHFFILLLAFGIFCTIMSAGMHQEYPTDIISIELQQKTLITGKCSQSSGKISWDGSLPVNIEKCILIYNPGYKFDKVLNADGRSIEQAEVTVKPELSLLCTSTQYSIGVGLSQAELWWIGKELSDFLSLELQVIYPTPKMLPEGDC